MNPTDRVEIGTTGVMVSQLGWGGSGIGNLYRESSDQEASIVIDAAFKAGVNYFDTAPMYGRGISEERLGRALEGRPRGSYVLSTKVSELIVHADGATGSRFFEKVGDRVMVNDWTREGTARSIEESLGRLQIDRADILYIHDTFGGDVDRAIEGTYPVLADMRDRGDVRAIGVGMGDCDILSRYVRECDLDCLLLWGSYSLLSFAALEELLPLCEQRGVDIVLGAPYESGILASDLSLEHVKYRYHDAPEEVVTRAQAIDAVCRRHDVPLKAAALQFPFGHPCVKTTIPGTRSPERLRENHRMLSYPIPEDLWAELKTEGLIPAEAPTS